MTTQRNGNHMMEEAKSSPPTKGIVSVYSLSADQDRSEDELLSTPHAHTITVTLTAEDLTLLDQVGQGNYNEGIRLALRAWRRESAARLSTAVRIATEIQANPASLVSEEELQRRLAEKNAALHVVAP